MVASDMVMPCGSASIGMFYAWKNRLVEGGGDDEPNKY